MSREILLEPRFEGERFRDHSLPFSLFCVTLRPCKESFWRSPRATIKRTIQLASEFPEALAINWNFI